HSTRTTQKTSALSSTMTTIPVNSEAFARFDESDEIENSLVRSGFSSSSASSEDDAFFPFSKGVPLLRLDLRLGFESLHSLRFRFSESVGAPSCACLDNVSSSYKNGQV